MNCMRCGREVEEDQVFCPECLVEMEKCPVKPDAPVRIPRRPDPNPRRQTRKKGLSEEEQIRGLRKQVRTLALLLAVAVMLIFLLAVPAVEHILESDISLLPGQNYSSAESADSGK